MSHIVEGARMAEVAQQEDSWTNIQWWWELEPWQRE